MSAEPVIPRALSINAEDHRFRPDAMDIGSMITIYLDGTKQTHVITFDADEAFIVRYALDADGQVQIDPDARGQALTEKVSGTVTMTVRGADRSGMDAEA